jgi:DNA-binding LacI/PurR family transcriptional regulator
MPTKSLKPTIVDVAKMAGCSVATVSRVLNGKDCSQKMERKIRDAVLKGGYTPIRKRKIRKVAGQGSGLKHRAVTLLWSASRSLSLTGQNLLQGLSDGLRADGITLNVDYLDANGRIPSILETGLVDGFFVHGMPPDETILTMLRKFPVVWLFQQGSHDFGDRVQPDHIRIGELAANYFHQKKFKRVCCLSSKKREMSSVLKARTSGFFAEAAALGLTVDLIETEGEVDPMVIQMSGAEVLRDAAAAAAAFTKLSPRPEGVYVANHLGVFFHMELTKLGITPMKDVCLIAGDTSACAQYPLVPEPITIRIFSQKIGQLGALRLRERIEHPELPETTTLVKPRLHIPAE